MNVPYSLFTRFFSTMLGKRVTVKQYNTFKAISHPVNFNKYILQKD